LDMAGHMAGHMLRMTHLLGNLFSGIKGGRLTCLESKMAQKLPMQGWRDGDVMIGPPSFLVFDYYSIQLFDLLSFYFIFSICTCTGRDSKYVERNSL
jgi:hypothetical protein